SLGVPVLVLRDKTERPEGLAAGCVRLVGTNEDAIVKEAAALLRASPARVKEKCGPNPYGDGKAGERIASDLLMRL
ncbi:MAG: UDP-N-acetyl glucosamine 2-epimerase, partial [Planctomycetota bacterium]|nr:UDP-N-acetyl glucosamine 2-epimerase [Planctomycetota bacterium]